MKGVIEPEFKNSKILFIYLFIFNYFLEVPLTCKKLDIFNAYYLISLEISIHL